MDPLGIKDETSPYPGHLVALLPGNSAKCFGKRRKFDSCVEGLVPASAIVDAWSLRVMASQPTSTRKKETYPL